MALSLRRFCLGAFAWLIVLALDTSMACAEAPSSGEPRKPGVTLDFAEYQEAVRAAFQRAAAMQGVAEAAAVAAFAELVYVESDESNN
jgi:hypothetical protein